MKKGLLIIGASGHGRVVADIALNMNKWESIGFLDDNESLKLSMGLEVLGKSYDAFKYIGNYDIFVGIGNNDIRKKIQEKLEIAGATLPTIIHPSVIIGKNVDLGSGTVIMPGAIINCSSKLGKGCIINTSVIVEHDNIIEDYVHLSPGVRLAGTVKVGRSVWIGIGGIVSNNVNITSDCVIGAGSVVLKDITKTGTYVGVPVRRV